MTGSSYQLNQEGVQYLSRLLRIIESQNWQALEYAILKNPAVFQVFARTISQYSELNGMTILHSCVRFDPPPPIVKMLIELIPESPTCVDCLNRTPLHIAAGTRASLPTLKLLAGAFPTACGIQDVDGKTPLHLACDTECRLFEGDRDARRQPPSYEVVRMMIKASPLSVPLEDQDDMSALEHAIFSEASIKVVKLLQAATRKQCREQGKRSHLMGKLSLGEEESNIIVPETPQHGPAVIPATEEEFSRRRGSVRRRSSICLV